MTWVRVSKHRPETARRIRRGSRGFTLLELVMVAAAGLLLSAMAVPQLKTAMSVYQLKNAVGGVTSAIQATRYRAIYQGVPYAIAFTSSTSKYQLTTAPTLAGTFTNSGTAVPFSNVNGLLSANASMVFRPSGGVQPDATTACPSSGTVSTITLTYSGKTGTITVSCYGNISVAYSL